jgi:hypothetical protein
MPKPQTEIWTIFGEIEEMVAKQMGFNQIPYWDIPMSARYNKFGEAARCAVVIPRMMIREFERRVEELRK